MYYIIPVRGNKYMKCCICGKEIVGYGNNPAGALDNKGNQIKWNKNDRCCDNCNIERVILGRLTLLRRR